MRDWLYYAAQFVAGPEAVTAHPASLTIASILAATLLVAEGVIGLFLILQPRPFRRVSMFIWGAFLVAHGTSLIFPRLGMCPCLGSIRIPMSAHVVHILWFLLCAVFFDGSRRMRPHGEF